MCEYVLRSIDDVCKANGMNAFNYYLRLSEMNHPYYSAEYLKEKLNVKDLSLVIVAGQRLKAEAVKQECLKIGVPEEIIRIY